MRACTSTPSARSRRTSASCSSRNPHLGDLWIAGEFSNLSRPASGHVYFTLKDGDAQLRAVLLPRRDGPRERDGSIARERRTPSSRTAASRSTSSAASCSFIVDFVQPEGAGALQCRVRAAQARLEAGGAVRRRRASAPLPRFPRRIGVVTSRVRRRVPRHPPRARARAGRWPRSCSRRRPCRAPTRSPASSARIDQLNRARRHRRDHRRRAAAARSKSSWAVQRRARRARDLRQRVPVVSAVGHETDVTIADFVADRARTHAVGRGRDRRARTALEVAVRLGVAAGTMESVLRRRLGAGTQRVAMRNVIERRAPDVDRERQRVDDARRGARSRRGARARARRCSRSAAASGGCGARSLRDARPRLRDRAARHSDRLDASRRRTPGDALSVRREGRFVRRARATAARRRPAPDARSGVPDAQAPLFTMPEERA